MRDINVGDAVVFVDSVGRQHNAIVTGLGDPAWHRQLNPPRQPWINLVLVSDDENKTDSYGRQIERNTSVSHKDQTQAHGMYWMFPGDEPNPIVKVKS